MTEPITLDVVFLFPKPGRSGDLGPLLDASVKEMEKYWNQGTTRITLRRHILSETPVVGLTSEWPLARFLEAAWKHMGEVSWQPQPAEWSSKPLNSEEFMKSSLGRHRDTFEPNALLAFVRRSLEIPGEESPLLLVVDGKIQPPEELSYVAARTYGARNNQAIVSTIMIDPEFWGIRNDSRQATVKQRFRAICIAFVGELMGLKHCPHPSCYMYEFTDHLETLDVMAELGPRHDLPDLEGRGFTFPETHPEQVQDIILHPGGQRRAT